MQLDSDLVLARLFPDGGVCGGGGWVGSIGKIRSAGERGSQRMLSGFWRMSILGREMGMAFVVGDMMWTETQVTGCSDGVGGT